jgi:hypothetical protein
MTVPVAIRLGRNEPGELAGLHVEALRVELGDGLVVVHVDILGTDRYPPDVEHGPCEVRMVLEVLS